MVTVTSSPPTPIDRVLADRSVRTVFQPILDLQTGHVVGAEALSRGPLNSDLERPDVLFGVAAAEGKTVPLDQLCISRAVASADRLAAETAVFVNVEPSSLASPATRRLLRPLGDRLVLEVTERDLARDPAAMLRAVDQARGFGARIALDDVGVEPASVAMLGLVRPDVVKLDLSLIQGQPDESVGQIATAVMAHAERTGSMVLAEGIETTAHVARARALGATLGQGFLFGRPSDTLDAARDTAPVPWNGRPTGSDDVTASTPFAALPTSVKPRLADTALLLQISLHLELQAGRQSDLVLLSAFQDAERFTTDTARRYAGLAKRLPFVAALGVGLGHEPAPGVRGASLDVDDPLGGEWSVIALGPHYCGALLARELGDSGDRLARRFEYVVTHDRGLVATAARAAMDRVVRT